MRRLMLEISAAGSLVAVLAVPRAADAQTLVYQESERGPRFLLASASTSKPAPVDVSRTPILKRRLSLTLDGATVKEALVEISGQSGLHLVYSDDVLPIEAKVHLRTDDISVAAALTEVLLDAKIDVVFDSGMKAALVPRPPQPPTGTVVGRVTNAQSGDAIEGAEVMLEGTRWHTLTGTDGQYRLAEVDTGTYVATVRRIGYTRQSRSVTVVEGQETTADFALQATVTKLEELVTTGTIVPTEVKALPTPVTVISEEDIALRQPRTVQELFRQAVPGAVSWDVPSFPQLTTFSTRGSSSLSGSGQMKVFVDGIETVNAGTAAVDPSSIGRIEVIRGPEAAAIYGSDAIGGVIQIFTKRGDPTIGRPQAEALTALGIVQTPYAGYGEVFHQRYAASVRGGRGNMSYNVGGEYSHIGDYVPNGDAPSEQSNASVHGGVRVTQGIVAVDVSGRYYLQNSPSVINPEFAQTGFFIFSKPLYQPAQTLNQSVGARLTLAPSRWWQHTVTVGIDRYTNESAQTQPRLTTPGDTLLGINNFAQTKRSIGYNTSLQGMLGSALAGALTVGFDHWSLPFAQFFTSGALNTTGSIVLAPGRSFSATRTATTNTGYFAQARLGFREALFLTGGARAEENTDFGDSLGTPVSPRVGLSFVQPVGGATLKLRSSWGRAIRAPSPGYKVAVSGATSVQLANPQLAPEQQEGWDGGIDAVFGTHGSLSVTYYNQTAKNLIQFVRVQSAPVISNQYQNVGRVKNTGIEVEGSFSLGQVQLQGQYSYSRARVEELGPNYTGNLAVGDQVLSTPKHTAGARISAALRSGTILSGGLTYVGSFRETDLVALFSCFAATGPCQPTSRGYLVDFPGFVKVNAGISQQITPLVSGFVAADNLTNNHAHELSSTSTLMGRITTIGLRLHY